MAPCVGSGSPSAWPASPVSQVRQQEPELEVEAGLHPKQCLKPLQHTTSPGLGLVFYLGLTEQQDGSFISLGM